MSGSGRRLWQNSRNGVKQRRKPVREGSALLYYDYDVEVSYDQQCFVRGKKV